MPKETPRRDPKYRKHKSGQARVTIKGRDYYLGKYGSRESKEAYNRILAEWRANSCIMPEPEALLSVSELILAYWRHAEEYYRRKDGSSSTGELAGLRPLLRILRQLYGTTAAARFGPLALKAIRDKMIEAGWCRNHVNKNVQRLKGLFKWAAENELVPPSVFHGLQAVAGLRSGRSKARESEPVRPVSDFLLQGARAHVSRHVLAIIDLQLLTGMRPGEACILRGCDLDTNGEVWLYRPATHMTEHRGHIREIYIGPRAQEILKPFLKLEITAYLFSPKDADQEHLAERRRNRKTPLYPSHIHQMAKKRARRRRKAPGDHYDIASYRRAITRACKQAFPLPEELEPRLLPNGKPETRKAWRTRLTEEEKAKARDWHRKHHWHPHQLRHNAATELRRQCGIEMARIVLGTNRLQRCVPDRRFTPIVLEVRAARTVVKLKSARIARSTFTINLAVRKRVTTGRQVPL